MKVLKYIIAFLSMVFVAASCYKDLSTTASESIPEIAITGLEREINIVWGQELKITPAGCAH